MIQCLKKEFTLCLHLTCVLFLLFAAFVFIPNYPYEVMFFFSGLSVFFISLTARENGDAFFSCTLPVRKGKVAVSRVLFCAIFQIALLLLAGVATAVKETCFSASAQINLAGSCVNLALLGHGGVLLGLLISYFSHGTSRIPPRWGFPSSLRRRCSFRDCASDCLAVYGARVFRPARKPRP